MRICSLHVFCCPALICCASSLWCSCGDFLIGWQCSLGLGGFSRSYPESFAITVLSSVSTTILFSLENQVQVLSPCEAQDKWSHCWIILLCESSRNRERFEKWSCSKAQNLHKLARNQDWRWTMVNECINGGGSTSHRSINTTCPMKLLGESKRQRHILIDFISIHKLFWITIDLTLFENCISLEDGSDCGGCGLWSHLDLVICCFGFGCICSHHSLAVFEHWAGVGAILSQVSHIENMTFVASQVLPEESFHCQWEVWEGWCMGLKYCWECYQC